jgi:UDP-2-acetamido-2-deoxy-ribo-hexuluronate aminotransferase
MEFNDLKTQYRALKESIATRMDRVMAHGQFIMGPEVRELEERLANFAGVRHCITASSGTDTLVIALMALGIGPGDEVITTPFTFAATAEAILLVGATPVFVDIDPDTFNLDPSAIPTAIGNKTRAILPVSLYGQCADLPAINDIAEKHGLPVIEDAAQSFGAEIAGVRSCGLSTIGSTSFFPSKPLGAYGDGGALFTDDDGLAAAMREIRVHGQDRRYHHRRLGFNARLDTIQAAVLLAKLERFEWEIEKRREVGSRYSALLASAKPRAVLATPLVKPSFTSVYGQYTVRVRGREDVMDHMQAAGIPVSIHYPLSLHRQPAFSGACRVVGELEEAERAAREVMSLPMSPDLGEEDQCRVVTTLAQA